MLTLPCLIAEVYAPAILPMLIVFCITSIECIGDTSATCEASHLATDGPELMDHIQVRGVLRDPKGTEGPITQRN